MTGGVPPELQQEVTAALRAAGARFALLHGSHATGTHRPDSDVDVASYSGGSAPASFEVLLPAGVDLLVLDTAPLEIAGRKTRKIYLDELPRVERSRREFQETARRLGGSSK
ncbi:hypothetical protein GCM10023200_01590 [Actinomycetospora chlora]|uniref:Polymerase nucleotidyl transferase domain-containing protein n=1 Tax=Actinomycetospora chlora TaxID=663608 RepID=A0ABP9A5W4_9PSEU